MSVLHLANLSQVDLHWSYLTPLSEQIAITEQENVDNIVYSTSVPTTCNIPRAPTALLVDLSGSVELLRAPDGHIVPLDTFIRAQVRPIIYLALIGLIKHFPESRVL
jgi:hypothetical protein